MSSEEVRQLLAKQPHAADSIPTLESYLDKQLTSGEGDIDANTALLKFHPNATNVGAIRKVLILAMKSMPESEFQLCLFLISQKVQEEQSIAELIAAWDMLECADFAGFWKATAGMADLASVPGTITAIRSCIVTTLACTYQKVPQAVLCSSLNLSAGELNSCEALVEAVDGGLNGDIVSFKLNDNNHFVPAGHCGEDFATVFQKVLYSSAMQ